MTESELLDALLNNDRVRGIPVLTVINVFMAVMDELASLTK